jgi:coenzyme F420 hydrogenase subunit beta
MKTFFNLIQEVQKPGLCHRCGGCVTFCTAVNYGALELDEDGKPRYGDIERCIECGLCHAICPEIDEMEEETKRRAAWSEPIGRIMGTNVSRAADATIRAKATDGGVVTALLLRMLERGSIDGAIVAKQTENFQRIPYLATTAEEIRAAAGFFFDTSHGMTQFSEAYMTHASVEAFDPMVKRGLHRVALVGTPCQIAAVRRMQTMELVPSDAIKFCIGLFCSGNFVFGAAEQDRLAQKGGFSWDDVKKVNIKEKFFIHLTSGEIKSIEMEDLYAIRRYACRYCADYSAEFADFSFGGIGAEEGWTTVIVRTPLGRAAWTDAKDAGNIEEFDFNHNPRYISEALETVMAWSAKKKKAASGNRSELQAPSVSLKH